jgi:solute carrier family 26 (sodium-independent sulfate anion transporter), member 11
VASRPVLRAIVLDFSAVNFIDVTSAQALVDLRNQFNRYAAPNTVEWHFAGVANAWTKRALVASGFGREVEQSSGAVRRGKAEPLSLFAEVSSLDGYSGNNVHARAVGDKEQQNISVGQTEVGRLAALYGVNRPFFHVDVATAVQSAVQNVEGPGLAGSSVTSEAETVELAGRARQVRSSLEIEEVRGH